MGSNELSRLTIRLIPELSGTERRPHGSEDQIVPFEAGAYTARRIQSARFIEIPGVGHHALGAAGAARIEHEIERFLTDVWQTGGWEDAETDRMLATVLPWSK